MGEIRVNLTNFITIGLMAFVFVFLVNMGMTFIGTRMGGGVAQSEG